MDILLHFAYGNLVAKSFHIGGDNSLFIGRIAIGLYLFILLIVISWLYHQSNGERIQYYIFSHLIHTCPFIKFEDLKLLDELISYNRKQPPKIYLIVAARHIETRTIYRKVTERKFGNSRLIEVELKWVTKWKESDSYDDNLYIKQDGINSVLIANQERKEVFNYSKIGEYKYKSWKDNVKTIELVKNQSIIKPFFHLRLSFDASAKKGKKKEKEKLIQETRNYDSAIYSEDEYICETIKEGERYYVNQEQKERLKNMRNNLNFFGGIVALFAGYTSIWDCFTYYEEGGNIFSMEKIVSDENVYKAGYMEEDEELEPINYVIDPKLSPRSNGSHSYFLKEWERKKELYGGEII